MWSYRTVLTVLWQVRVGEVVGPGVVAGHLVTREGVPIYQGLVGEGVLRMH